MSVARGRGGSAGRGMLAATPRAAFTGRTPPRAHFAGVLCVIIYEGEFVGAVVGGRSTSGPDMESYFDISNDLKDVWDADIDPLKPDAGAVLTRVKLSVAGGCPLHLVGLAKRIFLMVAYGIRWCVDLTPSTRRPGVRFL
ncbi:hypothetical protein RR46_14663 [Papilio xuthus]|uniref:Uncharacterized protein n=1 Tax=Papilio xuthus TaxID=66420 RepID=A0A194PEN8_PAPXU|nr:hypothetical protein RR46_14663 [Papilio xuthus]